MGHIVDTARFLPRKRPIDIDRAVRIVVSRAKQHVAVYRRLLFQTGTQDIPIRGVKDLARLPILDKTTLFRNASLEESVDDRTALSRCIRVGTSGSTGLPVNIYMSRVEAWFRQWLLVSAWRRQTQVPLNFRVADVGSWIANGSGIEVVRHGPVRVLRVSIGLPIAEQARLLRRHDPHIVSGYPTAIALLAEHLANTGRLAVPLVVTRGEVLHSSTRALIESGFLGRVADFYNCEEVGHVAGECPTNPDVLHINTDACVVEVVDDEGQPCPYGTEGRILLTNLFNCTMPFIRYDIRDRGALLPRTETPCSCDSRHPTMRVLGGRDDDYVYLPNGQRVSPRLIATAVNRSFSGLTRHGGFDRFFRQFQVIQDAEAHVTVRVIPEQGQRVDFNQVIGDGLRALHPDLRSHVILVDELPLEPSGKFKKVIRTYDPCGKI